MTAITRSIAAVVLGVGSIGLPSMFLYLKYAPDPDGVVNLQQVYGGSPSFTVPAGKDLVLTDWSTVFAVDFWVYVNGTSVWHSSTSPSGPTFFGSWDLGIVAHSGDVVGIRAGTIPVAAYAAGYLVDPIRRPLELRTEYVPRSMDLVRIDNATSYTVPSNRELRIREWAAPGGRIQVLLNGGIIWEARDDKMYGGTIRSGLVARTGDVVQVVNSSTTSSEAFVSGYLWK